MVVFSLPLAVMWTKVDLCLDDILPSQSSLSCERHEYLLFKRLRNNAYATYGVEYNSQLVVKDESTLVALSPLV